MKNIYVCCRKKISFGQIWKIAEKPGEILVRKSGNIDFDLGGFAIVGKRWYDAVINLASVAGMFIPFLPAFGRTCRILKRIPMIETIQTFKSITY